MFLEIAIDWNEFIIPQTVPNKPMNGAVDPTVAKKVKRFSSDAICFSILTSSTLLILSFRFDLFFDFNKVCIEALNNKAIGLSKFVGKQFMSNFSSTVSSNDVLDSFFTSDLNVVYEIKPAKIFKSVVFSALINNLFNTEYVDRGYYYTYDDTWSAANQTTTLDGAGYYPQATRNFLVGVTFKF